MALTQDELTFIHDEHSYHPVMIWDDEQDEPKPVVMVCGTIYGRNEFVIERARALARLGYVGVAMDVYGDAFATADFDAGKIHMDALKEDREELRERLAAGIDFVQSQPNVDALKTAVIGYCFGGLCALDVARSRDDVAVVTSFHGALTPPPRQLSTPINAKVLILHGDADPLIPIEEIRAVQEEFTLREADWQFHTYGFTYHSFAVPGANAPERGSMYNETVQERSWGSLVSLLRETF